MRPYYFFMDGGMTMNIVEYPNIHFEKALAFTGHRP